MFHLFFFSETSLAEVSAYFLPPNTSSDWIELGRFMLKDLKPPNLTDKKEGSINAGTISRVAKSLHSMNTTPTTKEPSDPSLSDNDHENAKGTHFENEFTRVFWIVVRYCVDHYFIIIAVVVVAISLLVLFMALNKEKIRWHLKRLRARREKKSQHSDDQVVEADDLSTDRIGVEMGEAAITQSSV